ncbi:MAG TPA: hypothetical protein VGO52_05530 [Hyphomonadaceae bacterium]|jgi:hypothetical protein|nr:hypothetical protein [Hyphomonadaceae bacterium]
MSDAPEPRTISPDDLGGPGPADATLCSIAALSVLSATVGEAMRLASVQLEVSSKPVGAAPVVVHTKIDKRTKSIAFASVEALTGDEMVFRAQALFGPKAG